MKFSKIIVLAALSILAVSCGEKLDKGLVLHSDFERDANDLSKYHFDGLLREDASISDDCAVGESSVYFNGERAYVEYPSGKVYFNRNYSVSIWVKVEDSRPASRIFDFNQVMPGAGNSVALLIGPGDTPAGNDLWIEQWTHVDEYQTARNIIDVNEKPAQASVGYAGEVGEWNHYVLVYDSSARNSLGKVVNDKGQTVQYKGEATLYVNGRKAGSTAYCFQPENHPTVANWLGKSRYQMDPMFKGWMDDLRIYNRCLSEKEIKALYQLGSE